ncbi:MAG: helix-turn-helix transcriptional regulator [Pseudomonadota bacterium]
MEDVRLSSDALAWAHREFIKNDPELESLLEEYQLKIDIGQQVYDLRTATDMTQGGLANLVGVDESTINELEQADYEGDSLLMLAKIATALQRRVEVRLVPVPQPPVNQETVAGT